MKWTVFQDSAKHAFNKCILWQLAMFCVFDAVLSSVVSETISNFGIHGRYTENYSKKTGFRPKKSRHCAYIIYRVKTRFFKKDMLYRQWDS